MTEHADNADRVDHPAHYNKGKYEVIDVIEDWELSFCLGNTLKYVARAEHKGTQLEDLKKARWYLDREIAAVERRGEQASSSEKLADEELRAMLQRPSGKCVFVKSRDAGYAVCDHCGMYFCDACAQTALPGGRLRHATDCSAARLEDFRVPVHMGVAGRALAGTGG